MNSIYQRYSYSMGIFALYVGIFALPFSRLVVNYALAMATVCVIFSGQWRSCLRWIWEYRLIRAMLAFLLLVLVGIGYSQASLGQALQGFGKYAKLLFMIFLFPYFTLAEVRKRAAAVFLTGVYLCIILYLAQDLGLVEVNVWTDSAKWLFAEASILGNFINPIAFSVLEAFAIYLVLTRLSRLNSRKWFWGLLFGLGCYHLFVINIERTGMLCGLVLFGLFILQRLKWQWAVVVVLIVLPAVFGGLYYKSTNFAVRVGAVKHDLRAYREGRVETSIGLRFSFWHNTWGLIKQAPWFGHGTGSFKTLYAKLGAITASPGVPLGDPHNEFILIACEWGALGLIAYLGWLLVLWREARFLPVQEQHLAQALIITIIVSSLTHVVMYTNATGSLFVLSICALYPTKKSLGEPKSIP